MPINDFNQSFEMGANLALKAYGIREEGLRRQMMEHLYQSQMAGQGLEQQILQEKLQAGRTPLSQLLIPKMGERLLPTYEPGQGMPPYRPGATEQVPMGYQARPDITGFQADYAKEAMALMYPQPHIQALPQPGYSYTEQYPGQPPQIKTAPGERFLTSEAEILSLPDTDPRKQNYLAGKRQEMGLHPQGSLDQAMLAKYGIRYIDASGRQKEEIDALVYGKGTGPVADAVKQVTGGKKQWYSDLNSQETKSVDQLVQRQAFNVQFGGQTGGQEALSKLPSAFQNWTQEQKESSFENFIVNKIMPIFAWRDSASRNAWGQEYNDYLLKKGISAENIFEKRAYQKATMDALDLNVKYYGATNRFVKNIETLADRAKELRRQYGINYGRLVNEGINMTRQGIAGSGDLAVIQQFITSVSLEVAKVESGELGLQAATESQQKLWAKIHDWNFDVDDLDKVLDASKELGNIRLINLQKVTNEFRKTLGEKEKSPTIPTPTPRPIAPPAPSLSHTGEKPSIAFRGIQLQNENKTFEEIEQTLIKEYGEDQYKQLISPYMPKRK